MKNGFYRLLAGTVLLLMGSCLLLLQGIKGQAGTWYFFTFGAVLLIAGFFFLFEVLLEFRDISNGIKKYREDGGKIDISEHLFSPKETDALLKHLEQLEISYDSGMVTELLKNQAEIAALQSQINPHFLYNTLETIRGLAVVRDVPDIADMSEALARIFRYNIDSTHYTSNLELELENVERYLLIQNYRFSGKFHLKTILEEPETVMMEMPRMSLQPIVENAVHHGLEVKRGDGQIMIRAYCTQDTFVVRVSDNGVGMEPEQVDEIRQRMNQGTAWQQKENMKEGKGHAGIALVNINQRIRLAFGQEYGLNIFSVRGAGTTVEMILPKQMTERGHNPGEKKDR